MDYAEMLRAKGLRATRPRVLIFGLVHHLGHPTVERIVQATTVDELIRSTVYRTVDTLEEAELLCGASLPNRDRIYHAKPEFDHAHVLCAVCGSVTDCPAPVAVEGLRIHFDSDFELHRVEVVATGRCPACAPGPRRLLAGTDRQLGGRPSIP